MDILNIFQQPAEDKSIVGYTYRHYKPFSPSELSKGNEIRIPIQCSDLFLHLSEGYVYIEGEVSIATANGIVKSVKNSPFYLFENARLEIGGKCIDEVRDLGLIANLRNLLCKSGSESKAASGVGWHPSDNNLSNNAKFDYCIPLKEIFPFCQDYNKIVVFVKPEIVLKRSSTDNNCFFSETNNEVVNVTLTSVYLSIPHVELSPPHRLKFLKIIEQGRKIEMQFRAFKLFVFPKLPRTTSLYWQVQNFSLTNRPIFIIVAFSNNRANDLKKDNTHFDHLKLKNMKIFLNSQSLPYESQSFNFQNSKCSEAYKAFLDFRKFYLGRDENDSAISFDNFQKNYPIFIFNRMFMEPVLKSGAIDLRIEADFHEIIPSENVSAYCLAVCEESIVYNPLTNIVEKK